MAQTQLAVDPAVAETERRIQHALKRQRLVENTLSDAIARLPGILAEARAVTAELEAMLPADDA